MEKENEKNTNFFDGVDYSIYLKQKENAGINIGKSFQAEIPEINLKKIEREKKELIYFKEELNERKSKYKKISELKEVKKEENFDEIYTPSKKRKIGD